MVYGGATRLIADCSRQLQFGRRLGTRRLIRYGVPGIAAGSPPGHLRGVPEFTLYYFII